MAITIRKIPCPDGTVTVNRDGVFFADVDVTSGGTATVNVPSVTPTGCKLMKTGQNTTKFSYDDAITQRGRLVDFFTLPSNNVFGNTNRFTDLNGNQIYANGIILDHSTDDGSGDILTYCNTLQPNQPITTHANNLKVATIGGLTEWFVPNFIEMCNVMYWGDSSTNDLLNYSPFNVAQASYGISSTSALNSNICVVIPIKNSIYMRGDIPIGNNVRCIPVRYTDYTELGL